MQIDLNASSNYVGTRRIDISANIPRNMLVNLNCVEASMVGNTFLPILKSIPVKRRQVAAQHFITFEPKNLEFRVVNFTDYMHFRMLRLDGENIDTTDNDVKIYITLIFRYKYK